jgi:hypothetical protein
MGRAMADPDSSYRDAAERLLGWLALGFTSDGMAREAADNVQYYYKMPAVFARGGRHDLAHRTLDQFERRFLAGDRLALDDDPVARPWSAYIGGWLGWGAGVLGRFDVARSVARATAGRQDAVVGGFWHEEQGARVFDSERSSAATMGCIWAGDTSRARQAGRFLTELLQRQSDPRVFYAYADRQGQPVPSRSDRNVYFSLDDPHARPALFATTIACLVWLYRQTGEAGVLDAAKAYMNVVLGHAADAARLPLATKTGWAAAMLYQHIKDPVLNDFTRRNADAIVARQKPDGSISFEEVIDVPKPVDGVWLVGWGCDCALTLLAAADGVA